MDWHTVLLSYGIDIQYEDEFNILCPFHEDSVSSCSINTEKGVWICFAGCGQGSLKYFIYKLSGRNWVELNQELEEKTWEIADFSFPDMEMGTQEPQEVEPLEGLSNILEDHWIFDRGFTKECIDKWGCKKNRYNDLCIPVDNKDNKTIGYITRRYEMIPKYMFSKGFKKSRALFGINHIVDSETLYVVEGALDAMWLDQNGYSAIAVLGAIVSRTQIDLISTLRPSEVVLCLDNDEAGRIGISKATEDMRKRFMLSYVDLQDFKDVQEIRDKVKLQAIVEDRNFW